MDLLTGICGSKGYCSGNAVVKARENKIPRYAANDASHEIARFRAAQDAYAAKLEALAEEAEKIAGSEIAGIFKAYRVIVRDEDFFKNVFSRVENENISIEYAVRDECRKLTELFDSIDDVYMRERSADVENVCNELIHIMMGGADFTLRADGETDVILVAADLSPSETMKLDKSVLRGIVTEHGGMTSHTVILSKALGIPSIIGVRDAVAKISNGDFLQVDAFRGEVAVNPGEECRVSFADLKKRFDDKRKLYESSERLPAVTADGATVSVGINTGDPDSIKLFDAERNDGIGLFRTEFIYMSASSYPDEETQFRLYRDIAERAGGKEVVIRTLDVGGEKQAPYMNLPAEENPALGYRAIRLCLGMPQIFSAQLRAILRASVFGNVKIMFPMISSMEELLNAKRRVEEEKRDLRNSGIPFREDIPIGIMVETPAAVMLSDHLAKESDFFSIGSNDLIQFITAADRANDQVQELYDSCNISVLRSVRMVAESAAKAGIPWSICGEVASEKRLIPLWVAMGVGGLSVAQSNVGRIKRFICATNRSGMVKELDTILGYSRVEQVKAHLDAIVEGL